LSPPPPADPVDEPVEVELTPQEAVTRWVAVPFALNDDETVEHVELPAPASLPAEGAGVLPVEVAVDPA
jgi:hypothetical protein